jgi:hypothetical protein
MHFDVLSPDGRALALPSLEASFEDPDDDKHTVIAAQVPSVPGRYALARRFEEPGRHHVHLSPAPNQPSLHIWFDLLVTDVDGKLPPTPAARPPKGKRRTPLASRGIQMIAPEPPPPPLAEPAGGDGASDPYHDALVEDEPLKTPARPQPQPPPRRKPPRPAPTPNPDGLE